MIAWAWISNMLYSSSSKQPLNHLYAQRCCNPACLWVFVSMHMIVQQVLWILIKKKNRERLSKVRVHVQRQGDLAPLFSFWGCFWPSVTVLCCIMAASEAEHVWACACVCVHLKESVGVFVCPNSCNSGCYLRQELYFRYSLTVWPCKGPQ